MKNYLKRMVNDKSKKNAILVSSLLAVIFLFLPFNHASAALDSLLSIDFLIEGMITAFFWFLKNFLLTLAIVVVTIGSWMMDVFLHPDLYQAVLSSRSVEVGWTTVRDFCNMFYVFFLLLMAFATITRNQTYSAKNLLPKLIISLFLINFSMVIAKIIIDFGQVFLFGFAAWMGSFSGAEGKGAGLTAIADYFKNQFNAVDSPTSSTLILLMFAISYTGMLGFLYMILAGFLLVRLVMFVFLIIVSPFAFFSMVLPSMKAYSSRWWSSLMKNAISGPIFIFFIYISAVMAQDLASFKNPVIIDNLSFMGPTMEILIRHGIALAMLWMAIPVSQELGTAGSKQLIGGTMGIGKIAMGSYAGYKIAEKTAVGAGGRAHSIAKNNSATWRSVSKKADNVARNMPLINGTYIKRQAEKAEKIHLEVEEHKKLLKNLTPEQMGSYSKSFLDPKKRAIANQAMMETLMEKGKMSNEDLMKAGYKRRTTTGDTFDTKAFQNDMKTVGNYGGDVSDVYKQRMDLVADPKDLKKEISKVVDKGEVNKIKLDVILDKDAEKAMQEVLGKDKFESWKNGRSQSEKDNYIAQREKSMAFKETLPMNPTAQAEFDKDKAAFREESALMASSGDRQRRMSAIDSINRTDWKYNYKPDAGTGTGPSNPAKYTQNIDDTIADNVMQKATRESKLDLDADFLKARGHKLSKADIEYIGKRGTTEQLQSIKDSFAPAIAANPRISIVVNKGGRKSRDAAIVAEYDGFSAADKELCDKLIHIDNLT